jgi:hypothetical protein
MRPFCMLIKNIINDPATSNIKHNKKIIINDNMLRRSISDGMTLKRKGLTWQTATLLP